MAVTFTDEQRYFVSEASVYRLLKAHDLITSPNFIVMKAASEFKDKTTALNQLWQTDFTYLKIIDWGWYYLSTILDDYPSAATTARNSLYKSKLFSSRFSNPSRTRFEFKTCAPINSWFSARPIAPSIVLIAASKISGFISREDRN